MARIPNAENKSASISFRKTDDDKIVLTIKTDYDKLVLYEKLTHDQAKKFYADFKRNFEQAYNAVVDSL